MLLNVVTLDVVVGLPLIEPMVFALGSALVGEAEGLVEFVEL